MLTEIVVARRAGRFRERAARLIATSLLASAMFSALRILWGFSAVASSSIPTSVAVSVSLSRSLGPPALITLIAAVPGVAMIYGSPKEQREIGVAIVLGTVTVAIRLHLAADKQHSAFPAARAMVCKVLISIGILMIVRHAPTLHAAVRAPRIYRARAVSPLRTLRRRMPAACWSLATLVGALVLSALGAEAHLVGAIVYYCGVLAPLTGLYGRVKSATAQSLMLPTRGSLMEAGRW